MRILVGAILILSAAWELPAAPATPAKAGKAAKEVAPSPTARLGSIARQLSLKLRLMRSANGTLAQALQHNVAEWEGLPPDERDQYRRKALAFLHKEPAEQERLLKHYEKLIKMSAEKRQAYRRRAKWLEVVVANLTPEQRRDLEKASPKERASSLLAYKAEMIRQGKLEPDEPATAPSGAPAPTTRPAE